MQSGRSHGFSRSLPGLVAGTLLLGGQAIGQAPAPEVQARESEPFQLRVESNLVTVRVVVRDAQERAVGNLRKEDFRLLDDGKPQEITGFTVESGSGPGRGTGGTQDGQAKTSSQIIPQRFVALYFDDLHLQAGEIVPVRDATWRYISEALPPEDRIAIIASSTGTNGDFTADRQSLHDQLFRLTAHAHGPLSAECPAIDAYQAYLIDQRQDKDALGIAVAEAVQCNCQGHPQCPDQSGIARMMASQIWTQADTGSRRALEAADVAVRKLADMPGQRILVMVSAGFLSSTEQKKMTGLIDRALRQQVVISAIDAVGLFTERPPTEVIARFAALQSAKLGIQGRGQNEQRDTLADLAAGTGGTFFRNSNDFNAGLRRAAQAPETWYTLTYSPRYVKFDGQFHSLKVTAGEGRRLKVEARRGYFAEPAPEKSSAQSELEGLVYSEAELQGMPATVAATLERCTGQFSTVTLRVHVDIRPLQFRKEADRNLDTLTIDSAIFDSNGRYVTGKESVLDFRLPDARLDALRQSGVDARIDFLVAPGDYRVRAIVRDSESKNLAAVNANVQPVAPVEAAAPAKPAKKERKARSMVDWSMAELIKAMPELKGLEAAQSQERLPIVLEGAARNVKSFFEMLPDIAAHERVDLEDQYERRKEEFNYLAVPAPGNTGVAMNEYRTNEAGKAVEPQPLQGGLVTRGVVSVILHFHPLYLSDSMFRYLGTQTIDGHPADVVCFAQIPGKASVTQAFKVGLRSLKVTVQEVAWMDSAQHHILRVRTEVLEPRQDIDLKRESTELQFTETKFKGLARSFWLPSDVTVTLNWQDVTYRNKHHYSQFQLFRVDSSER